MITTMYPDDYYNHTDNDGDNGGDNEYTVTCMMFKTVLIPLMVMMMMKMTTIMGMAKVIIMICAHNDNTSC